MTKRVFRYFFDFTDSQTAWLNEMAEQGWRLTECGQLSYLFDSCTPGEYEYAVDFVADKSYSKSQDYKNFLDSMGYKTFYKNINVGFYIGTVKWRPWGTGMGQLATAPGSLQKELIIVEKKKDGKPFNLHSDLSDSLSIYRTTRTAYLWKALGLMALAVMLLAFAMHDVSIYMVLGTVLCAALGCVWMLPALKLSSKIRRLKDEISTNEHTPDSARNRILGFIAGATACIIFCFVLFFAITMKSGATACIVFCFVLFFAITIGSGTINSGIAFLKTESSGRNHWNASYRKFNGYSQRRISLAEGSHNFVVESTTESGEINITIKGEDGKEYYSGSALTESAFDIKTDSKYKVTLRVDAKNHNGGYRIKWSQPY